MVQGRVISWSISTPPFPSNAGGEILGALFPFALPSPNPRSLDAAPGDTQSLVSLSQAGTVCDKAVRDIYHQVSPSYSRTRLGGWGLGLSHEYPLVHTHTHLYALTPTRLTHTRIPGTHRLSLLYLGGTVTITGASGLLYWVTESGWGGE